jgi:hypothetical protein
MFAGLRAPLIAPEQICRRKGTEFAHGPTTRRPAIEARFLRTRHKSNRSFRIDDDAAGIDLKGADAPLAQ